MSEIKAGDEAAGFEDGGPDLGVCPYYARYYQLPGHDPAAICGFGCREEPECITCQPDGGWSALAEVAKTFTEEG